MNKIYDLIILGGGPAGCAGAVYSARKKLSTLLITESFGGQSVVSETIYNWIGTPEISGTGLADALEKHVRSYPDDVDVVLSRVTGIAFENGIFTVTASNGSSYQSKTVLYTLGSNRRQLEITGASEFEHKGLTYCASCDGPMFSGQDVAVIGGGNAGFESALQLLAYCKSVTLLNRSDSFKADAITIQSAMNNPAFKAIKNVTLHEITGDKFVDGIRYSTPDESNISLSVSGIFVEIGQIPNTQLLESLSAPTPLLDHHGKIITDPKTGRTAHPQLWAAGDCTDCLYHQNNIATGDAVRALEDLYLWISKNR